MGGNCLSWSWEVFSLTISPFSKSDKMQSSTFHCCYSHIVEMGGVFILSDCSTKQSASSCLTTDNTISLCLQLLWYADAVKIVCKVDNLIVGQHYVTRQDIKIKEYHVGLLTMFRIPSKCHSQKCRNNAWESIYWFDLFLKHPCWCQTAYKALWKCNFIWFWLYDFCFSVFGLQFPE